MPTVHVAKQYLIYPLTRRPTLDIQSKQFCLTKPVSVKIFFYVNRRLSVFLTYKWTSSSKRRVKLLVLRSRRCWWWWWWHAMMKQIYKMKKICCWQVCYFDRVVGRNWQVTAWSCVVQTVKSTTTNSNNNNNSNDNNNNKGQSNLAIGGIAPTQMLTSSEY